MDLCPNLHRTKKLRNVFKFWIYVQTLDLYPNLHKIDFFLYKFLDQTFFDLNFFGPKIL